MSSAFKSASVARVIVPSTMTSGSCVAVRLVAARSRIFGAVPGSPFAWMVRTAAALPPSALSAFTPGASWSCDASIVGAENVRSFLSVGAAVPVTTTSVSRNGSGASWKSCPWVPGASVRVREAGA